jgi:hypothetical protein
MSYIGQTSRSLRQRYQEHIRYIRHNELQSSYAQHILNNKHEYGPINNTITLLKHINKTSLLLPYEQLDIHTYHQHKQLVSEQCTGKHNPIYQLIHDTLHMSLPTRRTLSIPHQQQNQTSSVLILLTSCQQTWYVNIELYYIGRTYRIFWNILVV